MGIPLGTSSISVLGRIMHEFHILRYLMLKFCFNIAVIEVSSMNWFFIV